MPEVFDTIVDPSGTPVANMGVVVYLFASESGVGPGYDVTNSQTILGRWQERTDSDGTWTVELERNIALAPENTYYVAIAQAPGRGTPADPQTFEVPAEGDGPLWVHDLLITPPEDLPSVVTDHPNLAAHELLGLASNDDLDAHAAASDPHGDRAYSDTHLGDDEDAHDASAISLETVVGLDATDVQAALEEIIFEGTTGNTDEHEAADDPHPQYQPESEKSQPDGYASLDGTGVVPDAELPTPPGTDAHAASAVSVADAGGNFSGADVETVLAELSNASTISFTPTGTVAASNVQDAIAEVASEGGGGGGGSITVISPTTLSAQADNYNPTGWATADVVRLSSDGSQVITGFAAGSSGETKRLAVVSNNVLLERESVSSSSANRITWPVAAGSAITLHVGDVVDIEYDLTSTAWRVVAASEAHFHDVLAPSEIYVSSVADFTGATITGITDAELPSTIARDSEVTSAISTHEADKTAVHGFTNTDDVARIAGEITGTGASPTIASTHAGSAHASFQPLDSDLTAIAALTTTSYGRALLALADAAALRTAGELVLGTDIYSKAAVDSGFQPLDSDLTAIAALTTTSFGRGLLAAANAAALGINHGDLGTVTANQHHNQAHVIDGADHTGDIGTAFIENNAVTLAKLATQADQTFLGNISGGAAVPSALTAAQVITALQGAVGGLPYIVVTNTADGPISSDATLNDDATLKTTGSKIAASGVYWFELYAAFSGATGGGNAQTQDLKVNFTFPSSPTVVNWASLNALNSAAPTGWGPTGVGNAPVALLTAASASASSGSVAGTFGVSYGGMIVNGANAGDITFQWCQDVSNAATLQRDRGMLRVWRIG